MHAGEEITTSEMGLVLLGIGAVGALAYFLLKKPAVAAAASPGVPVPGSYTLSTYRPPASSGGGVLYSPITPIRPTPPSNSFSSSGTVQVPPGANLTVSPNSAPQSVIVGGSYLTLTLPAGAQWVGVLVGTQGTATGAAVTLGGDMTSAVSIPLSAISAIGANVVWAVWKDSSGAQHSSYYSPHAVLTLHH